MIQRYVVASLMVLTLTGCATTKSPSSLNQLQIRVAQLENQMDEQGQDVEELKYAIDTLVSSVDRLAGSVDSVRKPVKSVEMPKADVTVKDTDGILRVAVAPQDVQRALKKAGYYDGAIDGKLGSGSQSAIKAFQKDHDLVSDGIVGRKTWAELKNYGE